MGKSAYSEVKSEIFTAVSSTLGKLNYKAENVEGTIDFSKGFGDISCSISFRIARERKMDVNLVANSIKDNLGKIDRVEKISMENGFINFHLDRESFAKLLFSSQIAGAPKGQNKGKRIIVEYPSVNPNKPWHIGHLRNALLGNSVANIYLALGYDVQRQDYIDDLGLQMAEITWWYINGHDHPEKKFDHWLGEEYVKVNEHIEEKGTKEAIANMLSLIDQDGTYESMLSRKIASECVKAQYQTAFDYGVYHEMLVWESDIVKALIFEKAMELLKRHSFIKTPKEGDYANCTVIDLEEIKELPEELRGLKETMKVLVRSDGTPTYLGKDIAFHMWKFGMIEDKFKYSVFIEKQPNGQKLYSTSQDGAHLEFPKTTAVINIIGEKQSHPQAVLRLAFKAMGKTEVSENIRHLGYGEVELESGNLSGRKGTWIGYSADDLLRETTSKTHKLMSERFKFDESEEERITKSVALAAIKFEFLKFGTEKKIVFSWEKALNFEGNSGPYAQYMHARSTRILEEAPKEYLKSRIEEFPAISDSEFSLAKLLSKETEVMEKALQELRPNVITEYINELAYAFALFYEKCPILKAESEKEKLFRICLTLSFKTAMRNMLELLGIDALEKM